MSASIVSRTASISPELLELVVRTGMWSPARGLDHARRLTGPPARVDALIAVPRPRSRLRARQPCSPRRWPPPPSPTSAPAPGADRPGADRPGAGRPGPAPARDERPAVLAQALTAATAITDDSVPRPGADRPGAAPARPSLLAQALTAATAITDDHARAQALTALAPHLPADQQPRAGQALTAATAITDDSARAQALTALAPHLPTRACWPRR